MKNYSPTADPQPPTLVYGPHLTAEQQALVRQLQAAGAGRYSLDEELALLRMAVLQALEKEKTAELLKALLAVGQLQKARKLLDGEPEVDFAERFNQMMAEDE